MDYIIKTTGECQETKPENGKDYTLKEMKEIVDGYIEILYLSDGKFMVVNEEGKLKGMPVNMTATVIARKTPVYSGETIVGDVLLCSKERIK